MKYIYALLDEGRIFYVGQTVRSLVRYESHINSAKARKSPKHLYILDMIANNRKLGYKILDQCNSLEANMIERKWVIKLISEGHKLCNAHYAGNRYVPKKYNHQL